MYMLILTSTQIPTLLKTQATTDLKASLNFCQGVLGGGPNGRARDRSDPTSYQSPYRPKVLDARACERTSIKDPLVREHLSYGDCTDVLLFD